MEKGKICVSVAVETAAELEEQLARALSSQADLAEVRFDRVERSELDRAVDAAAKSPMRVVATLRSRAQGGYSDPSRDERLKFWAAHSNKFYAVDLEADIFEEVSTRALRVLSFHDHAGLPADLESIADQMLSSGADVIKIAATSSGIVDSLRVWKLLDRAARAGKRIIPIAMGGPGKWTRILAPLYGSFLTYCSPGTGSETAPGQLTLSELRDVYRLDQITNEAGIYAVIGDPVANSLSPKLHNAAFASLGIDNIFVSIEVDDLDVFVSEVLDPKTRQVDIGLRGAAVTMPHKQAIISYLDDINPVARTVGAVNTVHVFGDKLVGFNTDVEGFIRPLQERIGSLAGINAGIVGAGGAALACAYALLVDGARVTILARDRAKAMDLFGNTFTNISFAGIDEAGDNSAYFDVLVNATPIGMSGEGTLNSLFDRDAFSRVSIVFDLVTSRTDTPLLAAAKAKGIKTIAGIEMLIAQAEAQSEIWTGTRPTVGLMSSAI